MHSFLELYKNSDSLHHAYYFVEHKLEDGVARLKHFIENTLGIKTSGNPDVLHKKYENFSVEDARTLTHGGGMKDFSGVKKIFIIETDFISEEAQNALLKIFEEPTEGTHFFIISPQDVLLPTLRSRMQVFVGEVDTGKMSKSLFDMDLKERLEVVKEITEAIKDEEKTKQDAITFLNTIEKELYKGGVEKNYEKLKVCEETRASLYDRGAPVKIILENLVLSI
jgi:DNA polymerase III delta prime subunit